MLATCAGSTETDDDDIGFCSLTWKRPVGLRPVVRGAWRVHSLWEMGGVALVVQTSLKGCSQKSATFNSGTRKIRQVLPFSAHLLLPSSVFLSAQDHVVEGGILQLRAPTREVFKVTREQVAQTHSGLTRGET